jgi:hypothetical protein
LLPIRNEIIDLVGRISMAGDEDVRELNPFLIDPAGTVHHLDGMAGWHDTTKE